MSTIIQHPGRIISELLEKKGRTQDELGDILGKPKSKLSAIINGNANITTERAYALGDVFGDLKFDEKECLPKQWLDFQSTYDLENITDKEKNKSELRKLKARFPIKELTKRGWLTESDSAKKMENQLKKLLGIESLENIFGQYAKYKRTEKYSYSESNMQVWLKLAQVESQKKNMGKYNKNSLEKLSKELHNFTLEGSAGVGKVSQNLSEIGVGLVVLRHFEKTRVDGATFWDQEEDRPVIVLSGRYDRLNNFRFTLAHEIGHVLKHEDVIKKNYITEDFSIKDDDIEIEANQFASRLFLSDAKRESLLSGVLNTARIQKFSDEVKVHPAIIVGRLWFEGVLDYFKLSRVGNEKIEMPKELRAD